MILVRDKSPLTKFTVNETHIAGLVQIFRFRHSAVRGSKPIVEQLDYEPNLILLPQFLSKVSNDFASRNTLCRIVHKYPLLERNHYMWDGLSSLRKQVITAAEKYLGPYSQVIVRFYTIRIPLIQIPHCRYAAQQMANMKKQKRSSHLHQPMSMNLFEYRECYSLSGTMRLKQIGRFKIQFPYTTQPPMFQILLQTNADISRIDCSLMYVCQKLRCMGGSSIRGRWKDPEV